MPWPYLFDPEDPEADPMSPFAREEPPPPMPPPVDFDLPDPNEETPTSAVQNVAMPSHILPFQSLPNPALEEYQSHIESMPTREANRASVGRRILASLAGAATGFHNPAAGVEAAERITEHPYQQAMEDWTAKGKSLEAAATQEGKTLGEAVQYRLGQIKDETARANLGARLTQIQKNYEVGMKNAKTAADRAAVLKAAQEETAKFHRELIGVRKTEAGASVTRAEAAKTSAEAAKARAEKSAQSKTLSSLDSIRVQRTAQNAVMAELPEASKYIETDDNGKVIGWKAAPSHWFGKGGWSPEEVLERNRVIKRYNELREEALKELNTRSITQEPPPVIPE